MWVVVSWSKDHTDITSQYIQLGVWGGLPLVVLFILLLARGFRTVAILAEIRTGLSSNEKFGIWAVGSSLFVIAVTGFSVSFFDQSIVFVYVLLGTLASAKAVCADSLGAVPPRIADRAIADEPNSERGSEQGNKSTRRAPFSGFRA